jgi:hypothetical protein
LPQWRCPHRHGPGGTRRPSAARLVDLIVENITPRGGFQAVLPSLSTWTTRRRLRAGTSISFHPQAYQGAVAGKHSVLVCCIRLWPSFATARAPSACSCPPGTPLCRRGQMAVVAAGNGGMLMGSNGRGSSPRWCAVPSRPRPLGRAGRPEQVEKGSSQGRTRGF